MGTRCCTLPRFSCWTSTSEAVEKCPLRMHMCQTIHQRVDHRLDTAHAHMLKSHHPHPHCRASLAPRPCNQCQCLPRRTAGPCIHRPIPRPCRVLIGLDRRAPRQSQALLNRHLKQIMYHMSRERKYTSSTDVRIAPLTKATMGRIIRMKGLERR